MVKKQHQLLVTLLLCNAASMEVNLLFEFINGYVIVTSNYIELTFLIGFGICNFQALPLYLDKLFNQYLAIILSVTFVLAFGEVCHFY